MPVVDLDYLWRSCQFYLQWRVSMKASWFEAVIFGLDLVGYSRLDEKHQVSVVRDLWETTTELLDQPMVRVGTKTHRLSDLLINPGDRTDRCGGILDTGDGYFALFHTSVGGLSKRKLVPALLRALHAFHARLRMARLRAAIHIGRIATFSDTSYGTRIVGKDLNTAARLVDLADAENLVLSHAAMRRLAGGCASEVHFADPDGATHTYHYGPVRVPLKHGVIETVYCRPRLTAPIRKSESLRRLIFRSLFSIEQQFVDVLFQYSPSYKSERRIEEIHKLRCRAKPRLTIFVERAPSGDDDIRTAVATDLRLWSIPAGYGRNEFKEGDALEAFDGFNIGQAEGPGAYFHKQFYEDPIDFIGTHIGLSAKRVSEIEAKHGTKWEKHQFPYVKRRRDLGRVRAGCSGCRLYAQAIKQAFREGGPQLQHDPVTNWHRLSTSFIYLPAYLELGKQKPIAVVAIDTSEPLHRIVAGDSDANPNDVEKTIMAAFNELARRSLPELTALAGAVGTYLRVG